MKTVDVALAERAYPIFIGDNLYTDVSLWAQFIKAKQVLVVTNSTIAPWYLEPLLSQLSAYHVASVILPDGEQFKTLDSVNLIFEQLLRQQFGRQTTLIALGGGVVGDMGGFAAACYQRGIAFIQIPTTLLAQVDSSVGGKTGVNHPLGKNMIGAFYQPQCVIADTGLLATLDARQFSAGLAEVIKYGLIRDLTFFKWLEVNIPKLLARDADALAFAIERSCLNKAQVVISDEFETHVRATLNLGHTFGHAIETATNYQTYLHGEAVAIGIGLAAHLSYIQGWLTQEAVKRIIALLRVAGLPVTLPSDLSTQSLLNLMAVDKKNVAGDIRVILLKALGEATLPMPMARSLLVRTLETYGHTG